MAADRGARGARRPHSRWLAEAGGVGGAWRSGDGACGGAWTLTNFPNFVKTKLQKFLCPLMAYNRSKNL